ncbi:MAG: hypothetical protein IJH37_04275 [Clostridia bacterium]|nr:hypothetical protein [Clostridia bacterium]
MAIILRKMLAVASSAAIAATLITVPTAAGAAEAMISYSDGYATATASGKLIAASYKENGELASVHIYDATADTPVEVNAAEGDKLMLWNGLDGETMQPLADTYTVEAPIEPTATSAPAEPTDVPVEPTATTAPAEPTDAPVEPTATTAPTEEPEELNIINTWKFDFGSAEDVAEGFTAVTADVNYTLNTSGDYQYGFIGTNEKDYKLAGGRVDGFEQQEGQVIELSNGGGTGLYDGIGSTGEDAYGNAGDKFYPVRFALNTGDEKYFRVKAYVTTLDPEKDAEASLYTERKHPLYTSKTIKAGETEITEFTVRTTPIYYEKSDPKGAAADGMVNVCVLGENTALAALEIYEIDTAPVLWVLGDSTVTDGGGSLPFWPLQNYTGVGTGLTKYLPKNIAMVNEGEGGLAANDNNHFNMVKNRIKAGDFMYVEYGHNHKSDGVPGYTSCLDKYYDACKAVGATLILVGPIDRHNESTGSGDNLIWLYDKATNTWSSTLSGFSAAAKEYVDTKIAAGATDIAFVDLNKPSLDWYAKVTKGGSVGRTEYTNDYRLIDYYFRSAKGASHKSVDGTHPNDAGAENLAYFFFSTADTEAYPALAPLMTRYKAGKAETPNPVAQYVLDAGWASNSTWPTYQVPTTFEYPITIKKIAANNEGVLELTAYVQGSFENYASGVIEFLGDEDNVTATYVTTNHVDNTTGTGTNVLTFANGVSIPEGQKYRAYMWSCYLDREELMTEEDGGKRLSGYYEPSDIEVYLLPGEDSDVDTFDYYGKTNLNGSNGWTTGGSAGFNTELGVDDADGRTYTNISVASTGNSWFTKRAFENLAGGTGSAGKYMVDVDLKYLSGANVTFEFAKSIYAASPFASGEMALFNINNATVAVTDPETGETSNKDISGAVMANGNYAGALVYNSWTNVKYILDLDNGKASVSVAGGTPVEIELPEYCSYNIPSIDTFANFVISGGKGAAFELQMSNLTVAKLVSDKLPEKTVTVSSADEAMGTAAVGDGTEYSAPQNTIATIVATPAEGYEFVNWKDAEGNVVGYTETCDIRMYDDYEFIAEFKATEFDPITYAYKEEFTKLTTGTLASNGWVSPNAQGNATIETDADHGSYLKFAPGAANDRNVKGTFPTVARLTEDYVLTFDMALTYGNNHASDFTVFDSSAFVGNNAQLDSGYILKLNNGASYSTTWKVNGTEDTVAIPAGTWVNVYMVVHPSDGNADIVIKNGETELFNKTEAVNGTGVPGGINMLSGRYQGVMSIDNIKLYTASQIAE